MTFLSIFKNENSTRMIKIGNITVSLAAFIALLSGLILAISIVSYIPNSYNMAMFVVIGFIILAYEINCIEVGKCEIWAWFVTFIYFFNSAILVYFIYKNKHNPMGLASDLNKAMDYVQSKIIRFTM